MDAERPRPNPGTPFWTYKLLEQRDVQCVQEGQADAAEETHVLPYRSARRISCPQRQRGAAHASAFMARAVFQRCVRIAGALMVVTLLPVVVPRWRGTGQKHPTPPARGPGVLRHGRSSPLGNAGVQALDLALVNSSWVYDGTMCNLTVELPLPQSGPGQWPLSTAQLRFCLSMFMEFEHAANVQSRNWCWFAVKEFGCHRHMLQPTSWATARQIAAKETALPFLQDSWAPLHHPHVCDGREFGRGQSWNFQEKAAAHVWFRNNVKVYVLSLPRDTASWQVIYGQLRKLRIPTTRVHGVDLRGSEVLHELQRRGVIPKEFNYSHAELVARTARGLERGISGTVSIAAAHLQAQARVLRGYTPLAVVLEDNVAVSKDFVQRLWGMVHEELPCDWDVVSLRSQCPYGRCVSPHLSRVLPDRNEPAKRCHHGVNYGFQGMLYRLSRLHNLHAKLKHTVFDETRPHCLDVDVALASISDEVAYYAVPAVQKPGFLRLRPTSSPRKPANRLH